MIIFALQKLFLAEILIVTLSFRKKTNNDYIFFNLNQSMGKSQETFNKKEREKKRQKRKKEKLERRAERKEQKKTDILEGKVSGDNFMYVDENGNLTPEPPDPLKKKVINVDDIVLGATKAGDFDTGEVIRKGTVKFFNDEKGYGFIIDPKTNESFFVHAAGLIDEIKDRDSVTFEVEMGPKGPVAIGVKVKR